jgi:haloalkane dehalogenase
MTSLRTPDSRFENLEGYPFIPNFFTTKDDLRMHFVDNVEGSPTIIMLHGEPSWSYLYRKMIHQFQSNNWRTIAPDLIGFGKSDKPNNRNDYTYESHYSWLNEWFESLDIDKAYLFIQDWGGLLGLRLAVDHQDKIEGLVIANTFLPAGYVEPNKAFIQWRDFSQNVPEMDIGQILNMGTVTRLSPNVIAAYNAPFPDETYKEGARQFPALVPFGADNPECLKNREYWKSLMKWEIPTLTMFSDSDPIMSGLEKIFQERIPGCKDQPHEIIKGGGHFLQEDKGEEIAQKIIDWNNLLK